ncbi:MAG: hypothetical protein ABI273_03185 [Lacunisphaera sp.]
MTGPVALRALAQAFACFSEFDRFVQSLQAALNQSDHFERLTIRLDRAMADVPVNFAPGTLTLPLAGSGGPFGTLQVAPSAARRQFGPEDLHLIAGLADFLSATLTQALSLEDAAKRRELLRFLLNQSPVGIAAFGEGKRLIVANDLASRWLAEVGVPFEDLQKNPGGFHLRASGKLIYGEARRMAGDASESWIVILQDLTSDQARLLELIKREAYRGLVESQPMGLAFIAAPATGENVLHRLAEVRALLLPGEAVGPYDAHRIGVIFPGTNGLSLRARLRKLRGAFANPERLRLGFAELGRDGRTPEALLEAALRCDGTYDEMLRPALLVHDDSAAVADTFALVLGREFHVVKSTSPTRTRELLATQTFEGFVTELELRNGVSGIELVRYAREKQPGIRPFLTTVQRAPYGLPSGASEADVLILEKPFNVAALTQTVRENLPS